MARLDTGLANGSVSALAPKRCRGEVFRFQLLAVAVAVAVPLKSAMIGNAPANGPLSFNREIRPILAENCYGCHGPDSSAREADLRLDRAEFATEVIEPGDAAASELIKRITHADPEERMPPIDSHKKLTPQQIVTLKQWVAEGAKYEEHWSLIPPKRFDPPAAAEGWARNPIDRFVAEMLLKAGLRWNREEDPGRLLRRLTFDLTGLPPTAAEMTAFLRDPSAAAYEREVDRLLASDAAAEHHARHWLDAVRYGDTHGMHVDSYRSIWPYRDWVIQAFRRNMPFDQFTVEQMAGDLLPAATLDQKIASGYNRCLVTTGEGGSIPAEYEAIYAKDRVETMSTVWLGLTTGCAACHDHKFDPITTREFYSLTAFFRNNTMPATDGNVADTEPSLFAPAPEDQPRWVELEQQMAELKTALRTRAEQAEAEFERWLATASQLRAPPVDCSVRYRLPLDEAEGPIKNPADATAVTSAPSVTPERGPGPFGPAPRLNDINIVVGESVPLKRESTLSFTFWIRVEGAPTGTVFSCLSEEEPDRGWEVLLQKGTLGLFFSDEKDGITSRPLALQPLAPDQWHHVVMVFDSTGHRRRIAEMFINGKDLIGAGVTTLRIDIAPSAPLRLGGRHKVGGAAVSNLTDGNVWVQDLRRYDRPFTAAQVKELVDIAAVPTAFTTEPTQRAKAQLKSLRAHFLATVDEESRNLAAKLDRLMAEQAVLKTRGGVTLVMEEKANSEPFAHVLTRGEYTQKGEKVSAGTPAALPAMAEDAPRNRLGLARWLVSPENPLTSRVTVNRLWQQIFGTGLVESTGDFGVTGSVPSHPELLDWLAIDFRDSGWNYRRLLRLLVTSATYRQSAAMSRESLERDPGNRLLGRAPRYRLEAEELRDQALAASDLLVQRIGGRPVRPYQPEGIWEEVAMKQSTTRFYYADTGENLYRRSLYTLMKRTAPPPTMDILNAPNREASCVRRDRTNTPMQALVTLNEPTFVEAARALAENALRAGVPFDTRLDYISMRLLGRSFTQPERSVLRRTLDRALEAYRGDRAAAEALLTVGASRIGDGHPAMEVAAWTLVASQVMNLDESLTK